MTTNARPHVRAALGAACWGAAGCAALAGLLFAVRGRLPDPMGTHWRDSAVPDGHASFAANTAAVLGLWAAAWVVLTGLALHGRVFERRSTRAYWWGFLAGWTVFVPGIAAVLVGANLDRSTWADARLSGWSVALTLAGAAAVGGLAGWLGRGPADPPSPGELDAPRLPLRPGQRSAWVGRVSSPALAAVAVASAAATLVLTLLGATGVGGGTAFGLAAGALVVLVAGLLLSAVRVRVSERGVAIGFGPLGRPVRRIPLERIERAWAEDVRPSQVGGWGLRGLPGSAAVMIRGGDCLVLRYRSGGRLTVSVDDAGRGAALVNALLDRRDAR
ncbi:hypothetical protein [Actinomadura atramentaria]|uniref:hypothetical protein n=1 Tax=Actinomadura atramentaria TaxID=1990 RepID=UPI0003649D20|nr:hypothetical protein [Actinomadura atramentaria]